MDNGLKDIDDYDDCSIGWFSFMVFCAACSLAGFGALVMYIVLSIYP
jgi:hypothetical protein